MFEITGLYHYHLLPLSLPQRVVLTLLPPSYSAASFAPQQARGTTPSPPAGEEWVLIEAGWQEAAGPTGLPGGKRDFFEAKVQVPFVLNEEGELVTFKSTLLFSSQFMAMSSRYITGLRSVHTAFPASDTTLDSDGNSYTAEGWLSFQSKSADAPGAWSERAAREACTGWWIGERTGRKLSRFAQTSAKAALPIVARLRLNLAEFSIPVAKESQSIAAGDRLVALEAQEDGWYETDVQGWTFCEKWQLESK